MDVPPDMEAMRKDFWSMSVKNVDHYTAIREVYERYKIMMEPHRAVGWLALDTLLQGKHDRLSVIYETVDPGKFPDDAQKAIGVVPDVPERIAEQTVLPERIYSIDEAPFIRKDGSLVLSDYQYEKAKEIIRHIFDAK
jgi:threonine synthase